MNENLRKMKELIAFLSSPRVLLVIQGSEAAPPTLEGSFEIVSVPKFMRKSIPYAKAKITINKANLNEVLFMFEFWDV
ncbi:hypothetical protein CFP56_002935 [Quercus suber]|uniref:Uncharacterized protein n=1 Tax=Quercus suber TaxID=58331 RepID=A0AAW0IKF9_QUESU